MHVALTRLPSHPEVFVSPPKGTNRIGWHLIVLRARRQRSVWIAKVRISCDDAARTQDIQLVRPLSSKVWGIKLGVVFLADCATRFRVSLYNASDVPEAVGLTLLSIPPFLAAIGSYLQNHAAFHNAFRSVSGSWASRVRKGIVAAAVEGQHITANYTLWTWFFDAWSEARLRRIAGALPAKPTVSVLVFWAGGNEDPLAATLASVRAQTYAPTAVMVARPGETGGELGVRISEYVAILQAGEVLPRHALLLLVHELGLQGTDGTAGGRGQHRVRWSSCRPMVQAPAQPHPDMLRRVVAGCMAGPLFGGPAGSGVGRCAGLGGVHPACRVVHDACRRQGRAGPPRAARVDQSSSRYGGSAL